MSINRTEFFERYRDSFVPSLTRSQADGYDAIFDYFEYLKLKDQRWLAYILATAYHETGQRMVPVREGFSSTDEEAIQTVTQLYAQGHIRQNYAVPHENGNSYFGRGLVQVTWAENYKKLGRVLGMGNRLYDNPSLALDLEMSVKILLKGMIDSLFNRVGLVHFFNATTTEWVKARKIVSGMDEADVVAGYAHQFYACLD